MNVLARLWIKDYKNYDDEKVREAYGKLSGFVGIVTNLVLFLIKFICGTLSGSVSITADAINNLSDAGSSIISLISFKLSSRPADEKHPFGHARYECIASMLVACLILVLGFELMKTSFEKILHPEEVVFSYITIVVLGVSIMGKLWMYSYNKKFGKLVHSSLLEATAADSLSDVLATSSVLISTILSPLIHFQLDGYMGVIVAGLIMFAGAGIINTALDEILGKAPDHELVHKIVEKIKSYDGVLGIHDLIVHDYGAHRTFASVHVEVNCNVDVSVSHDMIDNIERDFKETMGLELVIHMDPINRDDPYTRELYDFVKDMVKEINQNLSIHDFRIVKGETHTNLIFDVVVPYDMECSNEQLLKLMNEKVREKNTNFYLVVTFDRSFIGQVHGESL